MDAHGIAMRSCSQGRAPAGEDNEEFETVHWGDQQDESNKI